MRRLLIIATTLSLGFFPTLAQAPGDQGKSPRDVVNDFVRMDLEGSRLSPQGWRKAAHFFVRSGSPPENTSILVVSDNYELKEDVLSTTHAQVDLNFDYLYGRLDSTLHFQQEQGGPSNGSVIKSGLSARFKLAYTDKYWELESDDQTLKEVTAAPEWRIEDFQTFLFIDLRTAIRYVTEMGDKTTNPTIKKNADATLATLKKFQ